MFSLLNGDDIYATFEDIEQGQYPVPIISRIYIITFVTLFVTSVLNVFIFIIEDSYRKAKLSTVTRISRWDSPQTNEILPDDIEDSFSSKEILQIIFHNIEKWEVRMNQNPEIYGIPQEDPNENTFMRPTYDHSGNSGDISPYSVLLEEFGDEDESKLEIEDNTVNVKVTNTISSPSVAIESCNGDIQKLTQLLNTQIAKSNEIIYGEIQKKEEELANLREQVKYQTQTIEEICRAITNANQKQYEIPTIL